MVETGLGLAAVAAAAGPQSLAGTLFEPTLVVLLAGGLLGMSIRSMFGSLLNDDDDQSTSDDMGGDDLMGGGGDDMDDLGGLGGDDEFGDFGGDDEFGDMGGGDAAVDELEQRIDEMENEVGSLSSTVNTVRSENEEISQKVDDVQENVRKLLDIYEMVTRGVNPFADDVGGGMGGEMNEGSFGLFDDAGADEEEEEELDEDIAAADAEGFFDESLVGDEDEPVDDMFDEADESADDPLDDGGDFADDLDDGDDMEMDDMDDDSGDGSSKSFQELKDEYESGDADWAEEDADGEEADAGDDLAALEETDDDPLGDDLDEDLEAEDDSLFDEDDAEAEGDDDLLAGASFEEADPAEASAADGGVEAVEMDEEPTPDPAAGNGHEPEPEPDPEPVANEEPTAATDESDEATDDGEGKPYLATLPSGFGAELVLVEWLDFLVERSDPKRAAQAIEYYERIDWISEPVAEHMQDVLVGFEGDAREDASLTIDDHTRSLRYISELTETTAETVALDLMERGGVMDGIQR